MIEICLALIPFIFALVAFDYIPESWKDYITDKFLGSYKC